ncbi:hypothetical protein B0H10DRAFT_2076496, partial [Mycena sp. CBHHK59/15]
MVTSFTWNASALQSNSRPTADGYRCTGWTNHAVNLWTPRLQRRLDESLEGRRPVIVMSVHPGTVNTFAHLTPFPRLCERIFALSMNNTNDGAATLALCRCLPLIVADPEKGRTCCPSASSRTC